VGPRLRVKTKLCKKCGTEYSKPYNKSYKYCSQTCANQSKVQWEILTKICKKCGKEFTRGYGRSQKQWDKVKYCCRSCASSSLKWTKESRDRVSGENSPKFGKHQSIEIRLKQSEALRGVNGPNWKGGKTAERDSIRNGIEYRLWREAVFARDDWTCQKYGTKSGNGKAVYLHAHHIKPFSKYPELRFALDNGVTLLDKVHKEFHDKYGKINYTKEQFEEFIFT